MMDAQTAPYREGCLDCGGLGFVVMPVHCLTTSGFLHFCSPDELARSTVGAIVDCETCGKGGSKLEPPSWEFIPMPLVEEQKILTTLICTNWDQNGEVEMEIPSSGGKNSHTVKMRCGLCDGRRFFTVE